jgi:hypothetical protein
MLLDAIPGWKGPAKCTDKRLENLKEKCFVLTVRLRSSERRLDMASEICRLYALDDDEFEEYVATKMGCTLVDVIRDCKGPAQCKERLLKTVADNRLPTHSSSTGCLSAGTERRPPKHVASMDMSVCTA